jgi:2-polyprenyl-3-methyl-5-hydroxy-6-metoxy-1,4-benzoquinol methylase
VARAVIDPDLRELAAVERIGVDFTGLRVLDVGCGDGRLVFRIADRAATVVGVDVDEERIADARAHTPPHFADKVEFRVADIVELEDPPSSFDLVFFTWSL